MGLGDLDEDHRRGGEKGALLSKGSRPAQYLTTHLHRQQDVCVPAKDTTVQPTGYMGLTEVLLFFCFWSVHLFLVKYLPIYEKKRFHILNFSFLASLTKWKNLATLPAPHSLTTLSPSGWGVLPLADPVLSPPDPTSGPFPTWHVAFLVPQDYSVPSTQQCPSSTDTQGPRHTDPSPHPAQRPPAAVTHML